MLVSFSTNPRSVAARIPATVAANAIEDNCEKADNGCDNYVDQNAPEHNACHIFSSTSAGLTKMIRIKTVKVMIARFT